MRAFITGCTGQDGRYLSEFLVNKGYEVYGLVRRSSQPRDIPNGIIPVDGDVTDPGVTRIVEMMKPDEIYHLAAMSHVGESFKIPSYTFEVNAKGTLNVLEGARKTNSKFYQASTSELFGLSPPPQSETTPFYPRSPYGAAKLAAYWLTVNYRESYGLHACNGILFNHESPLRGEDFVTQKVCKAVAEIKAGVRQKVKLGNLEAKRDWGHASDFVRGMWLMLQSPPDDFVLATGETRTVREMVEYAFSLCDLNYQDHVEVDPSLFRPSEIPVLLGDPSKAKRVLGWEPEYTFHSLIEEMLEHALCTVG